jgi:topoisomerase IA-like protein
MILSRPVERGQMEKLLATGKTDLLQFVSARTKRPFSAFLVRQPDGKVGFEFEARDPTKKGRPQRGGAPLRIVGPHPADGAPIELHAGRYGPYVKHAGVNATVPNRDSLDTLTVDEAVALIAAKGGKPAAARKTPARAATKAATATPRAATARSTRTTKTAKTAKSATARKTAAAKGVARKTATSAAKTAARKR